MVGWVVGRVGGRGSDLLIGLCRVYLRVQALVPAGLVPQSVETVESDALEWLRVAGDPTRKTMNGTIWRVERQHVPAP